MHRFVAPPISQSLRCKIAGPYSGGSIRKNKNTGNMLNKSCVEDPPKSSSVFQCFSIVFVPAKALHELSFQCFSSISFFLLDPPLCRPGAPAKLAVLPKCPPEHPRSAELSYSIKVEHRRRITSNSPNMASNRFVPVCGHRPVCFGDAVARF